VQKDRAPPTFAIVTHRKITTCPALTAHIFSQDCHIDKILVVLDSKTPILCYHRNPCSFTENNFRCRLQCLKNNFSAESANVYISDIIHKHEYYIYDMWNFTFI